MHATGEDLAAVLAEFSASTCGQQLHDPEVAKDRCKDGSLALLSLLCERGFSDAALLNLARSGEQHYVVRIGDKALDPTARQFDSDASVPRVATFDEIAAEWSVHNPIRLSDRWHQQLHKLPAEVPKWGTMRLGLPVRSS